MERHGTSSICLNAKETRVSDYLISQTTANGLQKCKETKYEFVWNERDQKRTFWNWKCQVCDGKRDRRICKDKENDWPNLTYVEICRGKRESIGPTRILYWLELEKNDCCLGAKRRNDRNSHRDRWLVKRQKPINSVLNQAHQNTGPLQLLHLLFDCAWLNFKCTKIVICRSIITAIATNNKATNKTRISATS